MVVIIAFCIITCSKNKKLPVSLLKNIIDKLGKNINFIIKKLSKNSNHFWTDNMEHSMGNPFGNCIIKEVSSCEEFN